jgi:hypothetical protein
MPDFPRFIEEDIARPAKANAITAADNLSSAANSMIGKDTTKAAIPKPTAAIPNGETEKADPNRFEREGETALVSFVCGFSADSPALASGDTAASEVGVVLPCILNTTPQPGHFALSPILLTGTRSRFPHSHSCTMV